ncbi:MAG: PilZ domain-containing protein [Desulfobacterales bacterium]|jgi:hypothetical protein
MKTVYVYDDNQATIICAKCGFWKNIDTANYKNTKRRLRAKCKCGEVSRFKIEFRKNYRKNVRLPGEYIVKGKGQKGEILVRDISMRGIRFETLKPHKISKNDTLEVKFKLDNKKKSEICKKYKVIRVQGRIVGANYSDPYFYDKELGFYFQV